MIQVVKLNEVLGNKLQIINSGIPQGNNLGPILFIMYINSICDMEINGKVVSYANDTSIIYRYSLEFS